MSATRIARLAEVLWRGLDPARQDERHDARFCELLAEYEALTDQARGTCLRRPRHPEPGAALTQGALAWWRGEMAR